MREDTEVEIDGSEGGECVVAEAQRQVAVESI